MTNVPAVSVKRSMSKDHVKQEHEKKSKVGVARHTATDEVEVKSIGTERGAGSRARLSPPTLLAGLVEDDDIDDDDYRLGGGGGEEEDVEDSDDGLNKYVSPSYMSHSSNSAIGGRGMTHLQVPSPRLVASVSHRTMSQLSLSCPSTNNDSDTVPPLMDDEGGGEERGAGVGMGGRAVSDDVLVGGRRDNLRDATIHERSSSAGSSRSSATNSYSGSELDRGGTPSGNWGWFEDVHGHEGPFLFATSVSSNNYNNHHHHGGCSRGASPPNNDGGKKKKKQQGLFGEIMQNMMSVVPQRQEANTMAVTAPNYVLEESLSSQKLWKQTAGNRPPQPVEERAFFEQMWAQNFARSNVKYEIPVEVLTASTPISISPFNDDRFGDDSGNLSNYNLAGTFNMNSVEDTAGDAAAVKAAQADVAEATLNQRLSSNGAVQMYFDPNRPKDYNLKTLGPHHHHHTLVNKKVKNANGENDLTVLVRGDNVFGTTVSKSFPRVNDRSEQTDGIDTVSISIASYRVVESKKHGKYAQYLVIFCDGNFRNTVGVWKRYSDFSELSRKVTQGDKSCAAVVTGLSPLSVDDHDAEILPNAITSWRLLKKRQRWYRCLDAGYLSLKVFLLERFLHDILFESSNPQILRDFVGVNSSETSKINTKG